MAKRWFVIASQSKLLDATPRPSHHHRAAQGGGIAWTKTKLAGNATAGAGYLAARKVAVVNVCVSGNVSETYSKFKCNWNGSIVLEQEFVTHFPHHIRRRAGSDSELGWDVLRRNR